MNLTVIWCFLLRESKEIAVIGSHSTKFSCPGDLASGILAPLFDIFKEVCHINASASHFCSCNTTPSVIQPCLVPHTWSHSALKSIFPTGTGICCVTFVNLRVAGTLTNSTQCDQFAQHSSHVCSFTLHFISCNSLPCILRDTLLLKSLPLLWADTYFQTPFTFFFMLFTVVAFFTLEQWQQIQLRASNILWLFMNKQLHVLAMSKPLSGCIVN